MYSIQRILEVELDRVRALPRLSRKGMALANLVLPSYTVLSLSYTRCYLRRAN